MKFECGDLEQALRTPELMPEAREHLRFCAECRREYQLWLQISSTARSLHEEWETPELWGRIRSTIEAGIQPAPPVWKRWPVLAIAAAILLALIATPLLWQRAHTPASHAQPGANGDDDFLTEQALAEVEKNEAAYRQSIDKLSRLAEAKLKKPASPYVANEQEKLLAIDSAIDETRANVKLNRFNVHLQTTLADLYREKQQTLEELLSREQKN
ncbi:MAG TPA: hypothetical protein VKX25_01765 [Bryobacteraceae bacterium]|jgi:hypothetical protein|nr:hypothetical protein [Bryobacteraceae bacterium]